MTITRRGVLTTGVVASSTLVLAACANEPAVVATTDPSGTVQQTLTPTSGEVLLGEASGVLVGTGKKFEIDSMLTILVTQPKEGVFKAFSATCTHAGCIVNGVQNGQIACGCHGARFDQESGMVLSGPAKTALGKIPIEVRGTSLWVTL